MQKLEHLYTTKNRYLNAKPDSEPKKIFSFGAAPLKNKINNT